MIGESLKKNTSLARLSMAGDDEQIFDFFIHPKKKKRAGTRIGDEGTARICEALMENTSLTSLDLSCPDKKKKKKKKKKQNELNKKYTGDDIGVEGSKRIAEMLSTNSSLTKLDLNGEASNNLETREREKEIKENRITTKTKQIISLKQEAV